MGHTSTLGRRSTRLTKQIIRGRRHRTLQQRPAARRRKSNSIKFAPESQQLAPLAMVLAVGLVAGLLVDRRENLDRRHELQRAGLADLDGEQAQGHFRRNQALDRRGGDDGDSSPAGATPNTDVPGGPLRVSSISQSGYARYQSGHVLRLDDVVQLRRNLRGQMTMENAQHSRVLDVRAHSRKRRWHVQDFLPILVRCAKL